MMTYVFELVRLTNYFFLCMTNRIIHRCGNDLPLAALDLSVTDILLAYNVI